MHQSIQAFLLLLLLLHHLMEKLDLAWRSFVLLLSTYLKDILNWKIVLLNLEWTFTIAKPSQLSLSILNFSVQTWDIKKTLFVSSTAVKTTRDARFMKFVWHFTQSQGNTDNLKKKQHRSLIFSKPSQINLKSVL